MYSHLIDKFITREKLPASYAEDARRFILPLAERLLNDAKKAGSLRVVGINGAQGTGKSTLSALLTDWLEARGKRVANLCIDDFYLGKAARERLAQTRHPLLRSRGVPGTHNVAVLCDTLTRLRAAQVNDNIPIPRFDKSMDDAIPESQWPEISGPVDFILLEGWFVGAGHQSDAALQTPLNELETNEDPDGSWRRFVNQSLAVDYEPIFARLQHLIMLQAPSFEQVYEWRRLQENKLRQRSAPDAPGLMDEESLRRFIQHFERLTRHCLADLPARADVVLKIDTGHRLVDCLYN